MGVGGGLSGGGMGLAVMGGRLMRVARLKAAQNRRAKAAGRICVYVCVRERGNVYVRDVCERGCVCVGGICVLCV